MKKTLTLIAVSVAALALQGATPTVIKLWAEGSKPYDNHETVAETMAEGGRVRNVSEPELTIYTPANFGIRPEANARVAIMSCPGGGYSMESVNGSHDMADWYNSLGITFAVLKYRMPNGGHYQATMADAEQGMRLMRQFAAEHDIEYVGIMGASAGGHLASSQATHFTDSLTRPDFQVLLYPVITLDPSYTHKGTRSKFLGPNPPEGLEQDYSNNLAVTDDTPPAILLVSYDDTVVPVRNSIDYFMAMRRHNVPCALYVYPSGDHGWGHIHPIRYRQQWHDDLQAWLEKEVIAKANKK